MPGATPVYGIRYPFITDPIGPADFQNFAEDVDAAMDTLDAANTAALLSPTWRAFAFNVPAVVATPTVVNWVNGATINGSYIATPTDRFTVAVPGVYLVTVFLGSIAGFTTLTSNSVQIYKNGNYVAGIKQYTSANSQKQVNAHALLVGAPGDFFQAVVVWTGTGGPATLDVQMNIATMLQT